MYKWTELKPNGEIPCERSSHSISFSDNKLYLFGGEHEARNPIDSSVKCYDIATNTWSTISTKSEYTPQPRVAHSQCIVNNSLYIFGGRQGILMSESPLNDMWCFSLTDYTWSQVKYNETNATAAATTTGEEEDVGVVPDARSFHAMIASSDNLIYVFGGCGEKGRLNDLYSFDVSSCIWTKLQSFDKIRGRGGPCLQIVMDNLYVLCGFCGEECNDIFSYDLKTKEWRDLTPSESLFRPRSVAPNAVLDSKLILFGGEVDTSNKGHEGAGAFENDIISLSVQQKSLTEDSSVKINDVSCSSDNMKPCPRGWTSMCAVSKSSILLFGGLTGSDEAPTRLNDLWKLELIME